MKRIVLIVIAMLAVPATAYGGGGGRPSSQCPGFAEGAFISMLDSCFAGTAQIAPAGTTLTVSNDGILPHTITAVDGSFDSGILQPGETFQLTIDQPGLVRVFCVLHGTAEGEGMAGVIVAEDPQAATAESDGAGGGVPVASGAVAALALAALAAVGIRRYSRTRS